MSGCQRCLECGCLAVSDVLCADVWLSAMSCVRMSGCQRCLVSCIDACRIVASVLDLEFASHWRNHCILPTISNLDRS